MRLLVALPLLLSTSLASVCAQPAVQLRAVEAGTQYESVSGGFADTRGVNTRIVLSGGGGTWQASWGAQERFGEAGVIFGVGHSRLFGRRWLGRVEAGSSTAGAYHARFRAGTEVGRKWGAREHLVTSLGAWVHDARDVHRDAVLTFEAAYYAGPVVVQVGGRYVISNPGAVRGHYAHAALTHSRPSERSVSFRAAFGREAYLLVEPLTAEVGFRSWEAGLTWIEPVYLHWSLMARIGVYHNPYYERGSLGLGVVAQF